MANIFFILSNALATSIIDYQFNQNFGQIFTDYSSNSNYVVNGVLSTSAFKDTIPTDRGAYFPDQRILHNSSQKRCGDFQLLLRLYLYHVPLDPTIGLLQLLYFLQVLRSLQQLLLPGAQPFEWFVNSPSGLWLIRYRRTCLLKQ